MLFRSYPRDCHFDLTVLPLRSKARDFQSVVANYSKGGKQAFAALCANGSYAQLVTFAKSSGRPQPITQFSLSVFILIGIHCVVVIQTHVRNHVIKV